MGSLFSSRIERLPDIFIDFDAELVPKDSEKKLWDEAEKLLSKCGKTLQAIDDYKGAQDLVKKAMETPTPEKELEAFEALLPIVDVIASFRKFAKNIEKLIPQILGALAERDVSKDSIEDSPALVKQLAQMFNFALQFDQLRMMRPHLSNDFSYYRRLLPKFGKTHPDVKIKDDEASGMALFTAEHIPMMGSLVKGGAKAKAKSDLVTNVLVLMANGCLHMIRCKKFESEKSNLFAARAMVGAIILFDHIDSLGAFHKKTPIALKQAILLLKRQFETETVLLNSLHYSTKNFFDDNTPQSIQDLFD